ncbi:glycoside hydrolase family 26 protein [Actinoplanes xinjiangensis]|uniref:glycoside hydrolase family 26 protein n=1 Tax=Actinoplanes xinjiangensis TaxID=512350 RepID=UPI00342B7281
MEDEQPTGIARRRVLGLMTMTVPAAVLTAGVTPPAEAAIGRGGPVRFRPGKAMLGSYLSLRGRTLTESLALRRKQLGRDQRIVHRYYPWTGYAPVSEPEVPPGAVLMVSWDGTFHKRITSGRSDRDIALMATRLAGMRRPIMLRWGWEMNGNWFDWDGTHNGRKPSGYIRSWRRMHRIFREEGATNVAWVWGPNWNSGPDVSWNRFQNYYPGDSYVDWVGVSGYNFSRESPRTLFTPIVDAYGGRKPIVLAETAAIGHGRNTKAPWIRRLSAYVAATPSIGAVVWFDTDNQKGTSRNFRPDTDDEALAAYRKMARSTRFSG